MGEKEVKAERGAEREGSETGPGPGLSRLFLDLEKEHVTALMRTALRMKQIQDRKLHAELVMKFQDGKLCPGGGFMVKD